MKRTTIVAEESVIYRLKQLADSRGVSFGEIVREALDEKVKREQPPLTFLGADTEPLGDRPTAREIGELDLYEPVDEGRTDPPDDR